MASRTPPPDQFDRRLIVPMILGSLLNPVNSSMLAVALVPIGIAFGAPPSETIWLVSALYLATAVGQPVVGRLVDLFGPKTLYLVGAALVGAAGVLGALAPNLGTLVLARVLIGLGTCAGYPAAMYLLRTEGRRTGKDSPAAILSALAISVQVFSVVGPTIGGLLIDVGGWRAVFTVNIPLAAACLVLGALRIPTRRTLEASGLVPERGPARLDPLGMVLFGGMLVTAMLFLMDVQASTWYLPVAAVVLGALFVRQELRTPDAFIDLRVLGGNTPLLLTYVRQILAYVVSYSFLYGFTSWLEAGYGLTASQAGLVMLPLFAVAILTTALSGRSPALRSKLVVGAIAQVVACSGLLLVDADTSLVAIVCLLVVLGVPQGIVGLANQNALYFQADPDRIGASSGLLRTFTYLGALVASAANAAFFRGGADTSGLHDMGLFTAACGALLLVVVLVDRSLSRSRPSRRTAGATA
ncbi:MFS transporter [Luteimicrobium subarcticum]|uniref:MFS transporter n=1 Tax=Luteimicrobium subarcticum TaxID=620910 RepID=A0A2M8WVT3_9MICO|nr:MFS transporter [Luteimicrobium subarcticum]PJI95031.1 MFS transporter [Luteimicrobium subarcticum]